MDTGIGPSAVSRWLQDRSLRLAAAPDDHGRDSGRGPVLLPVSIALRPRPVLDCRPASAEQGNGRRARRTACRTALKSPYANVLLRITQRQVEPLDLPVIASTFERSLAIDTFITRYYVWSDVTDEHRGEVLAYDRDRRGFTNDVPEAETLVRRARATGRAEAVDRGLRDDHRRLPHVRAGAAAVFLRCARQA